MDDGESAKKLKTGRLGRLASMVQAGLGTASALALGRTDGLAIAVDRLGELRGMGTKVGQMAGLVEANLTPEMRAKVGPALAKLRAQAARSSYEDIARIVEEDLGALPETLFATFSKTPFASASLGQVHEATDDETRRLAVKVQHPGIREAFENDLSNVTALGRVATSFIMPAQSSQEFIDGVKAGFVAELDYGREAESLVTFARLVERDPDLEVPSLLAARSSARVLTTTYLRGETVEIARDFPLATRRRQAAAIRRFLLSAIADHGLLYADAHAGNFLFRHDGTVGVLDFGSTVRFEDERRLAFVAMRDAASRSDRAAFGEAVRAFLGLENRVVSEAIAEVQWIGIGGLVRGEAGSPERVSRITRGAGEMKKKILRERFALPHFVPFLMRTMLAANALLAALDAPESGPVGTLGASVAPGADAVGA